MDLYGSGIETKATNSFLKVQAKSRFNKIIEKSYIEFRGFQKNKYRLFQFHSHIPFIHPIVDNWIYHCIGHGQPIEP